MDQYKSRRKLGDGGWDNIEWINPEFEWYGFKSISFVHVLLSKLFFLPILILLAIFCFVCTSCPKCICWKSKCIDKIFTFYKLSLFCNLPLWYFIEIHQDLMIAAIKNVSFIGTNKNYDAFQMVNFALGLMYIVLCFGAMVGLFVYFCTLCGKTKKKQRGIQETFTSMSPRSYPWLAHLLIFSCSRFIMALFITLFPIVGGVACASVFLFVCLVGFCLQLPLKIYNSIFINMLNLTMELSLVYLALFTLIGEAADLNYNQNEILGLVTIIFLLLG